jgi:hypothetical protein
MPRPKVLALVLAGGPGGDAPALVGEQAQIPEGATVDPGARFGDPG